MRKPFTNGSGPTPQSLQGGSVIAVSTDKDHGRKALHLEGGSLGSGHTRIQTEASGAEVPTALILTRGFLQGKADSDRQIVCGRENDVHSRLLSG